MNDRLTKWDWINQGLRTLAHDGHGALKAAPMAQKLNVSRGSFYWHFRDIHDFKSQLLQSWAEYTTDRVQQKIESEEKEADRLRALVDRVFGSKLTLEWAVRAWATEANDVAEMVASVDARRLAYIQVLLLEAGVPDDLSFRRAAFLYWALLGKAVVMDPAQTAMAAESVITDLCELFIGKPTNLLM